MKNIKNEWIDCNLQCNNRTKWSSQQPPPCANYKLPLTFTFLSSELALRIVVINKMRFHLLGFLSVHALLNAQAFTPSGNRKLTQRSVVDRYPLPIRHSSTAVSENKKSWNDLHHFNIELDKLAEYSGNFNQPVISKAAECEELWASQLGDDSDGSVKPDTVSFNTVLKAWNRCCNVLSEASRTKKSLTDDFSHNSDVYTVRDAAKRATTLLLQQEKEGKCPLDTQSFNIVIGMYCIGHLF